MPTVVVNELGKVVIADEVIATAAGIAALDCYGLADMAPRRGMRDSLSGFLGRENPGRGVEITSLPDHLEVDLSIVVSYGTRIPEVAANLREKVRYTLQETFGIKADKINIHVQGVKVVGER
ncbi:Asp23/Gls24 family envelope stress response protein [Sulfoacidibacillus thermotolerans]|uniref:Alkaline-shock protein n=1 Tax=Sulfoacidibacillus thermotolerans TaxID=1765684 RepID=A0A2U3D7U8_SULT2|nr:Asp23/Gls24 family envelope stress response protein [Sulfoacidibacillus thermotolerans]PWI57342.1 hypothetical protein BM613_09085 [Sulfoacidibacillus thermotolerans]